MPPKGWQTEGVLLVDIRRKDKKVSLLFVLVLVFEINLDVFDDPVDEKDDCHGHGGLTPEAVAAHTTHSRTAPYGGRTVEAVDGEAVFHDDTSSQETNTRDNLRKDTEVVVVDWSAGMHGSGNDAFGQQDEQAGPHRYQGVDSEASIAFAQLAFYADEHST